MTVSRDNNHWIYSGNGTATGFTVDTRVDDASHLRVILVADSTKAEDPQVLNTDYTVSGLGEDEGCTVDFTAAPASGQTVLILLEIPLTQAAPIANLSRFDPVYFQRLWDELVLRDQRLQEQIDRCIKVPVGEQGFTASLANIATRASKRLGFTSAGALDYLTNAPGAGSFLNLPTALAFQSGGKVLWQSGAGAGGGTVFYADAADIVNEPLETVTYATSTTLSTGDSGKAIKSTGQTTNIVYTLPAGASDLFYVIHCDSDAYMVTVDPNGSERIANGAAGGVCVLRSRGWIVLQWDGGRWEITEAAVLYGVAQ